MPNAKKKVSRTFFSYTKEKLKKAIEAVKNGTSKKSAPCEFNIPHSTLTLKIALNTPFSHRKTGPSTELSETEEKVIESWLLAMARRMAFVS